MSEKKKATSSRVSREIEKATKRKEKLREKNKKKEELAAKKSSADGDTKGKSGMPKPRTKGIKSSAGTSLRNTTKAGIGRS